MAYLTRACLRRDASVSALAPLLLQRSRHGISKHQPSHHLVWSLFADRLDRRRDFLWHESQVGEYLLLSDRIPQDSHRIFDIDEPKLFNPSLNVDDRLQFKLRANPVIRRRDPTRKHSTKHDVVMDALRILDSKHRSVHRHSLVREQGVLWLEQQGSKRGFKIDPNLIQVEGYDQHTIVRRGKSSPLKYSSIDFNGILTVVDPSVFLAALKKGFGASKAFGCGLMLIRRA